jgi:hypothetical protein
MPLVSITRLRVRSWLYLPMFAVQDLRSARQASKAEGNIATRLLRDRHRTFWTSTIWTTEAAMKAFMLSGTHGQVMRKLLNWCDEAAVAHWNQESAELPLWTEVFERLQRDGRPSKVNHPSPAHTACQFPKPHVGPTSELRFK